MEVQIKNYKIEFAPQDCVAHLNWYDAEMYCRFLGVGGTCDWRLPTINELQIIADNKDICDMYVLSSKQLYWSSELTNDSAVVGLAAAFRFTGVTTGHLIRSVREKHPVRPVRTIKYEDRDVR